MGFEHFLRGFLTIQINLFKNLNRGEIISTQSPELKQPPLRAVVKFRETGTDLGIVIVRGLF
jgi:hypothetical protein